MAEKTRVHAWKSHSWRATTLKHHYVPTTTPSWVKLKDMTNGYHPAHSTPSFPSLVRNLQHTFPSFQAMKKPFKIVYTQAKHQDDNCRFGQRTCWKLQHTYLNACRWEELTYLHSFSLFFLPSFKVILNRMPGNKVSQAHRLLGKRFHYSGHIYGLCWPEGHTVFRYCSE